MRLAFVLLILAGCAARVQPAPAPTYSEPAYTEPVPEPTTDECTGTCYDECVQAGEDDEYCYYECCYY